MTLVGNIIKNALQLSTRFNTGKRTSAISKQRKQLRTLLKKAADTEFGKYYHFEEILKQRNGALTAFRAQVPIHDYNSLFNNWWYKNLEGGEDILLLTMMLASAEGSNPTTLEDLQNKVSMFTIFIAGTSLYRKGLVKAYFKNMSFNDDSNKLIVFEKL